MSTDPKENIMKNNNKITKKNLSSQNPQSQKLKLGEYPGLTFTLYSMGKTASASNAAQAVSSSNNPVEAANTPSISSFKLAKPVVYQEKNWHGTKRIVKEKKENLQLASPVPCNSSSQAIRTAILIKFSKNHFYRAKNKTSMSYYQCILNQNNISEKEHALKNAVKAFDLSCRGSSHF